VIAVKGAAGACKPTTIPQLSQTTASRGCFAVIAAVIFGQNHAHRGERQVEVCASLVAGRLPAGH
jgi:hypothetical protein